MLLHYNELTDDEVYELNESLASGCVTRSCPKAHKDYFACTIGDAYSRVLQINGSYRWSHIHGWVLFNEGQDDA
jgi:hypothetical protein